MNTYDRKGYSITDTELIAELRGEVASLNRLLDVYARAIEDPRADVLERIEFNRRNHVGQCIERDCENDAEWVLVVSYPASNRYREIPCCDDCAESISYRENVIDGHRLPSPK